MPALGLTLSNLTGFKASFDALHLDSGFFSLVKISQWWCVAVGNRISSEYAVVDGIMILQNVICCEMFQSIARWWLCARLLTLPLPHNLT